MDQTRGDSGAPTAPMPRRRRGRAWLLAALVVVAAVAALVTLGLTGRVISAPGWVVARIEARANAVLAGEASARIGGVEIEIDGNFVPHVQLADVELYAPNGNRIAVLPELGASLRKDVLLRGKVEPRSLRIAGAQIVLTRLEDGRLDLSVGTPAPAGALRPAELLQAVDDVFALPVLRDIERIEVEDLGLRLDDQRTGRVWTASGGWLTLDQTADRIGIDLGAEVAGGTDGRPARAEMRFASVKGTPEASLSVKIADVHSRDLAIQSPALAFLGALDAPISGAFETGVGADGDYLGLSAVLEIGAGALQPTADNQPVRFDWVRLDMGYDPDRALVTFSDIAVESASLRVKATAKAWLKDFAGAWPDTIVSQLAISDLRVDPEGVFADPVAFSQGALDFRLRLDPFRLDIGQLVLVGGDQRISGRGEVTAAEAGWGVAVDVGVNQITAERLMALWPVEAVPKTRDWLEENVATAEMFDVRSAFRLRPGEEPHFTLGYDYRDTEVRFLKTLPPIQNGAGYATINDYTYTLVVDRGHVTAPQGGEIDVAGSVMRIADLREKPAPAEITLRTESSITAALSLLDQKPFEFLRKAGRPVDLAEGRARLETRLDLRLADKVRPEDVGYAVSGTLIDVRSEKLAPGRLLTAGALDIAATPAGLEISGPATFSGVPVEAAWRQKFGPEHRGKSELEGMVELSPRFLDAFAIGLPPGSVQGEGRGQIALRFEKGKPVEFRLESDLGGLTLSIPEIGWSKGRDATGRLAVAGRLSKPAEVDLLEIEAPGLAASGRVVLAPDGGFAALPLASVRIGDWFEGSGELRGRGKGQPPAVIVQSGSLDMRRAAFGRGRGGGDAPLSFALDRLRISEGISLAGFRGEFTTGGGLSGDFTGLVNAEVPVVGRVLPADGRSAFRVHAADAGAALRAAGIFTRGVGGTLDLALDPSGGAGEYDGRATIEGLRVVNAPALASLLNAVSVVGLLSQLNGPGIPFDRVTGDFRLTPGMVHIRQGSATGPSLGISAAGIYDAKADRIDLQGTISPVYLINQIGRAISRAGEGLFGFNYRMTGPSDAPQVSVNPLSILTPGMFREIFRSNPPKPSQ